MKTSAAGGENAKMFVGFYDSAQVLIAGGNFTPTEDGTVYVLLKKENVVIPSGAVYFKSSGQGSGSYPSNRMGSS